MGIEYLKKAAKTPETETAPARTVVDEMLAAIACTPPSVMTTSAPATFIAYSTCG